jgi:hypothetical protein
MSYPDTPPRATPTGIPTRPVRTGNDPAVQYQHSDPTTRQFNDFEERDSLWGSIDALYALLADEAEANHGYADFLEKYSAELHEGYRAMITAIMADELKHTATLLEMVQNLSGVVPAIWATGSDVPSPSEVDAARMIVENAPLPETQAVVAAVNNKVKQDSAESIVDEFVAIMHR